MTFADDVLAFRDEYVSLGVMPDPEPLRSELVARTVRVPDGIDVFRAAFELLCREIRLDDEMSREYLEATLAGCDSGIRLFSMMPSATQEEMREQYARRAKVAELLFTLEKRMKDDGWRPEGSEFSVSTRGVRPASPAEHLRGTNC